MAACSRDTFDQVVFDDHTEQQSWFLEPFNLDRAVFFYCDNNLAQNLDNYFSIVYNTNYNLSNKPYVNVSHDQFDNANLVAYFRNLVYNNKQYYDRIRSYYVKDYDLINSAKFYAR